jgi:hypothetical protein
MVWLNGEGQEEAVSLQFADVPLWEGVERLLQRHNFVLFYAPDPAGLRLKQVWIASTRKATHPPAVQEAEPHGAPGEEEAGQSDELTPGSKSRKVQNIMQPVVAAPASSAHVNAGRARGMHWQHDVQANARAPQ